MVIFDCEACSADIYATDVFKVVPIFDTSGWVALNYRCRVCKLVGKASASHEEWDEVIRKAKAHNEAHERLVSQFREDMEVFDTVSLLQSFWASLKYPPLIEENIGKCGCATCRKKERIS